MSVQSSAPRRRLDPDERKAEILAAARRLFGTGTYSSVSTTDLANEAGVARGLINHYFGGKRGLYLEVVRQMMVIPAPVTEHLPKTTVEQRLAISVDRWLDVVERNREMWLTAIGPEAIGRDPEVEEILAEGDEIAADRVLEAAMMTEVTEGRETLRAIIRSYGSMIRAASREWLVRGTLSRSDLHVMLTDVILHVLTTTFPNVLAAQDAD
ncbi:TetR/AcrR family transcriptional regulator [Saccharopolyspora gloriosae]|uniref:TetR/AcrR family transcriptional regulator n=1 Tax=Saccharopolyspora gloriosae TaxID=455344 RepID=UPI001FB7514D|nr:TetR/AcrR family transcriptional regulator [Saccharopolyspora gloriosae]